MKNEFILFGIASVVIIMTLVLFWANPLGIFFGVFTALFFAGCGYYEMTN